MKLSLLASMMERIEPPAFATAKSSMEKDNESDMTGSEGMGSTSDEVAELKFLRTKDIGDTLTPEQQMELDELRSSDDEDDMCDDEDCCDEDCPTHGTKKERLGDMKAGPQTGMGMSSDTLKGIGESGGILTFAAWKAKAKKTHSGVWFEGDADTCQAFIGPKPFTRGETKGVGEWGGDSGYVSGAVKEGFDRADDDSYNPNKTTKLGPKARAAMANKPAPVVKKEEEEVKKPAKKAKMDEAVSKEIDAKIATINKSVLATLDFKFGSSKK